VSLLRALSLMRPRGVGGLHQAFVGRTGELDLLLATYARAVEQGGPHMVTIMADVGVGKTRLVRELWELLGAEEPEPVRRTGRCLAYGRGITYWPLGEILKEHLGILENDSPDDVRRLLGDREILGLTLGLDLGGELHPLAARDRLHDAWVELVAELASERPVVLLLEDLHWAEEPLLDLLERLVRDVRGPLFVIGTARPELLEARPSWGGGMRNASLLWLEPLRAEDAAEMVDALLAESLPETLRQVIVERAEGNPFFVEELIGTLIDRGVLERRNGGWSVNRLPSAFEIPDTVQAVVAARLDLLPAAEKGALQAAAVTGRIFWEGPVVELLDEAEPDFQLLETRDFIRRRSGSTLEGEREYAFKHSVTREVAYGSLPKARRARLHAAFATWLQRVGGGRDEHAPLLAHHYAQAVQPEDADLAWGDAPAERERLVRLAATWLRRAGELAVSRYDLDEGIRLLHQAVDLETDATTQAELWREIGRANALGFQGPAFWEAMERSLELTDDRSTRGETYAELGFQTSFRGGMWTRAPDRALVSSWIAKGIELTEPGSPARVKALSAHVFWDEDPEAEAAREASATAEELGDPDLRAVALYGRSLLAYRAGRFDEALEWVLRPLDFIDQLNDPERVVEVYEATVPVDVMLGRFNAARAMSELHQAATRPLSAHHRLHGIAVRTELEEASGEWTTVRDLTPRIEETVAENLSTPCVRNERTLLVAAAASRILGDVAKSERIEAKAESLGMEGYDLALSAPRLRLALLKDDVVAVERLLSSLPSERKQHVLAHNPSSQVLRMEALVRLGDSAAIENEAVPLLEYRRTYIEPFALRALGQVRGDRSLIEQALARFEEFGLGWHADQTRKLLTA
jgi:tetratricopeptide (TPR) repeat protein